MASSTLEGVDSVDVLPDAQESCARDRRIAACAHAGAPLVLPPIAMYALVRREGFAKEHVREALGFGLSWAFMWVSALAVTLVSFAIGSLASGAGASVPADAVRFLVAALGVVIGVPTVVFAMIASTTAYAGKPYRYRFSIRWTGH